MTKQKCKKCGKSNYHAHYICKNCRQNVGERLDHRCIRHTQTECKNRQNNENNDVKDAVFTIMKVYNKEINVMIDTGSQGSVISQEFLKQMGKEIEKSTKIIMIDINGERKTPLGKISNVIVEANNDKWELEMLVTSSTSYNVVLGNDWLSKVKGTINFKKRILVYEWDNEYNQLPISCWQKFKNPQKLYKIELHEENNDYELELEEINEDNEENYLNEIIEHLEEQRYNKVQIEKDDTLLQITKEKKTVIGQVNEKQKEQLRKLLLKYEEVIAKEGELGQTDLYQHHIYTENVPPISQRAYQTGPKEDSIIKAEIEKGLKAGLIRPSKSPWTSPVVLVKKKDGKTRFCVDYRKLNEVTKKDKYPLPRIEDILNNLGKAKWFTSIDLASGYWQVQIAEQDKEKTAFISKYGTYEYNVMPFGLCNAPATFQRLMNNVLGDTLWKYTMDYIDDISIFSETWEDHLRHIEEVLKRLKKAKLKINTNKCHFATKEMQFLGHLIGVEGIKPDPNNIVKVKEFPRPRTLTQLRSFIGLSSYYRRFIEKFSKIAIPLFKLTKKEESFEWTDQQEEAFNLLKEKLTTKPILKYPDFSKKFILLTDASEIALGAILSQKDDEGKEHPILYDSRTLNVHEKNYETTKLEALAIIWALKKYRHYLYGRKFTIITDHNALTWLFNSNKSTLGYIVRWRMILQDYDYEIVHRKGKIHQSVDALSRINEKDINTMDNPENSTEKV